jgi:hypothetical protein
MSSVTYTAACSAILTMQQGQFLQVYASDNTGNGVGGSVATIYLPFATVGKPSIPALNISLISPS